MTWSRMLLIGAALFWWSNSATAQQAPEDARKDMLVREMLELSGGGAMISQVMDQILPRLKAAIMQKNPDKAAAVGLILDELREVIQSQEPALLAMSAALYRKHFTTDELEAMVAFNRTPAGQSMIKKMPLLMAEMTPAIMAFQIQVLQQFRGRLEARAKELGLQL